MVDNLFCNNCNCHLGSISKEEHIGIVAFCFDCLKNLKKKNKIYKTLWNFRCPKIIKGKKCKGILHNTKVLNNVLEFVCRTCNNYTTAIFDIANIIINDTKKPPVIKRD